MQRRKQNTLVISFAALLLMAFPTRSIFSQNPVPPPAPDVAAPVAEADADTATAVAQAAVVPVELGGGMDMKVSLEFRSTEAAEVIRYLAQKAGLNISISSKVSGRVSIMVTDVPIQDIFDLVLKSNNLAFEKQGEVIHVMTDAEYKELYGEKFSDMRQVKTFRLQYAVPEQAFNMLDTIKSSIGRLLIDEKSGTVMIMDTPDRIEEMEQALSVLERKEMVRVFDLRYAKVTEVQDKLKDEFETKKLGSIKGDERTNQLIVRTFPDRMTEVEELVAALDRKTRQVLIDAKIVKVNYTTALDTGIDWNTVFTNIKFNGMDATGDFRTATDATTPGEEIPGVARLRPSEWALQTGQGLLANDEIPELIFTTVARDGYELFRYLKTIGETKIISKPKLLVTENQDAKIHVGTREAFITSTTTTGTSTATTAEKVEFIDVGIQFGVKPRITDDGYIEMSIKPEISSVVRRITTASGSVVPIVDTSMAETKVLVKNGATVVIGGLRKNTTQSDDDEIPYLGRIPLIGKAFFKQQNHDDAMDEIIIFITPHIADGDKLITGDEKEFGGDFKSFRDYDSFK